MVNCTKLIKNKIVKGKIRGDKIRQIAQNLDVSLGTVGRINGSGYVYAPPPKLGRPPIINCKSEKFLVNNIIDSQTRNATIAVKLLNQKKRDQDLVQTMQRDWLDVN